MSHVLYRSHSKTEKIKVASPGLCFIWNAIRSYSKGNINTERPQPKAGFSDMLRNDNDQQDVEDVKTVTTPSTSGGLGGGSNIHVRLIGVNGFEGRCNDLVYCQPARLGDVQSVVVFFGGDVQDFTENMESHRDNKNYIKWNLDNTAMILHHNFPESHIVVIRPSRMEYKTFSCFENFVPSGNCGAPDHTPNHNSLQHLELLLQNISEKLRAMSTAELEEAVSISKAALVENDDNSHPFASFETEEKESGEIVEPPVEPIVISPNTYVLDREGLALENYEIKVVGFSKGCVVLNQFLYEFHYLKTLTPDDNTMMHVVSHIKDLYWLDGGHSGGKNTWITSRPLLETLTRLNIGIHIHVTPYQIQDDRRPWIKKEEKNFYELLLRLGAQVERTIHFEHLVPNLNLHFEVLKIFGHKQYSSS